MRLFVGKDLLFQLFLIFSTWEVTINPENNGQLTVFVDSHNFTGPLYLSFSSVLTGPFFSQCSDQDQQQKIRIFLILHRTVNFLFKCGASCPIWNCWHPLPHLSLSPPTYISFPCPAPSSSRYCLQHQNRQPT